VNVTERILFRIVWALRGTQHPMGEVEAQELWHRGP
jgi:hypothetical protein